MLKDYLRNFVVKRSTFDSLKYQHSELSQIIREVTGSKSEYFQDLWVIASTHSKKNGFFAEIGASDGLGASNTWLLEKAYGWHGILAEPARANLDKIQQNRICAIDSRAVWDKSGKKLLFCEREETYLSSVSENETKAATSNEYFVDSISLTDLLIEHSAPIEIDYISIDIEGSELRVLKQFFSDRKFEVKYFTIEHNWRKDKREIITLMKSENYRAVMQNLSYRDLFFVKNSA
jgi:FkbM family methyltransferase